VPVTTRKILFHNNICETRKIGWGQAPSESDGTTLASLQDESTLYCSENPLLIEWVFVCLFFLQPLNEHINH
jgi:hypothetical protein